MYGRMGRILIPKTSTSMCPVPDTSEYQALLQQLAQARTAAEVERIRVALHDVRAKYVYVLASVR